MQPIQKLVVAASQLRFVCENHQLNNYMIIL